MTGPNDLQPVRPARGDLIARAVQRAGDKQRRDDSDGIVFLSMGTPEPQSQGALARMLARWR